MYYIQLLMAKIISSLYPFATETVRTVVVEKKVISPEQVFVEVKDPMGLVRGDMVKLRQWVRAPGYNKGDTLADVAFRSGQYSIITLIENKLIGGK